MMDTLIGTATVVLTLSGRIEMYATPLGNVAVTAWPGIGVSIQNAMFQGPRVKFDVETMREIDYSNYPRSKVAVERNQDPEAEYLAWAAQQEYEKEHPDYD